MYVYIYSKMPISLVLNDANSVLGFKDFLKFGRINDWSGNPSGSAWGISSIFGGGDNRIATKETLTNKSYSEPVHSMEQALSMIHLREVYIIFQVSVAEYSKIFPSYDEFILITICWYSLSLQLSWGLPKVTQSRRLLKLQWQNCCWDHTMTSSGRTLRTLYLKQLCTSWYSHSHPLSCNGKILFRIYMWNVFTIVKQLRGCC